MLPTASNDSSGVPSRACALCGEVFYSGNPNKYYCSSQCRANKYARSEKGHAWQRAYRKKHANRRMLPPERSCERCGKAFPLVNGRHWQKRFCTDECRNASLRKLSYPRKPRKAKSPPVERICKGCEQTIPSENRRKRRFCSKECAKKNGFRAWVKANPELRRKHKQESYLRHAETERKRNVAYNKAHPEERRLAKIRRRGRERGAAGSYTLKEFSLICEKQGGKCAHCKKKCKLTVDHIVPLSKGGTDFAYNLQALCSHCNTQKLATILPYAHPSLFDTREVV